MSHLDPVILRLGVALGIGLLIGTERERRKGEGPDRAPAGLRTFALASLTGAIGFTTGGVPLLAVLILGVFGLTALAYWRARNEDPGLTTEIALSATTVLGGLTMTQPGLAAGVAVMVTILLSARTALHGFVRSGLSEGEVRDALIFAAATLIVLPLLPDQAMGPFGALNPHAIWIIAILVMGIGAVGHIAVRLLGPSYGLPISGLASGFVSSAATIGAMGARALKEPLSLAAAAAGAVLSTVATIIQLALVLAATNMATLYALRLPLAFAGLTAIVYGAIFATLAFQNSSAEINERGHAFSVKTALTFVALLCAILLASRALDQWFGAAGLVAAAGVAGFVDTHSAAISVATLVGAGKLTAGKSALPILLALTTNTATKVLLAATAGGFAFARRVIPGLILVILAAWAGWAIRPA
jgi:uncharacterized membrane protein (DUF4010 family)